MTIESRVSDALHGIRAQGVSLEGWAIHMGLGAYRQLKREVNPALAHVHVVTHVRDMPVKVNLNLADGEIVLRYEVKA